MVGTQGGLGSTAAGLRLHGENAGERGWGETEGMGANQRVSRITGEEAELTEATNAADARRRPWNGRWTPMELRGHACRVRERARVFG
jgi:hypothetical protein